MGNKRQKSDHRADLRGKPFIGLPAAVVYSEAYTRLSLAARAVLTEILGRFNGYNNGLIGISSRELCARLNTTNARRISDATRELFESGLIDIAVEGRWKARQARLFRLTFINSGKAPPYQHATNEYTVNPAKAFSRADNASARKPRFAERASAGTLGLADTASAANLANPPFGGLASADTASALIFKPYQGPVNTEAQTPIDDLKHDEPALRPGNLINAPWQSGVCEQCEIPFASGNRGLPKRFCSETCRKRAEAHRRAERKRVTYLHQARAESRPAPQTSEAATGGPLKLIGQPKVMDRTSILSCN